MGACAKLLDGAVNGVCGVLNAKALCAFDAATDGDDPNRDFVSESEFCTRGVRHAAHLEAPSEFGVKHVEQCQPVCVCLCVFMCVFMCLFVCLCDCLYMYVIVCMCM